MFKSIRFRLIASYLLVILLAMGIAALLAWTALDRAFLDVLRQNLLAQAQRVAQTVEASETGDLTTADTAAAQLAPDPVQTHPVTQTAEAGEISSPITSSVNLPQQALDPSQDANLTPGNQTRVIDDEGVVILGLAQTEAPRPTTDPYSQALNVLPGYHTHIIEDDGAVILSPDAVGTFTTGQVLAPLPLTGNSKLASNLGISPADERGESTALALLGRSEVQSALAGDPATAVRSYDWAPARRVLYAAYPVRSPEGSVTSVVYVASPLPRLSLSLLPATFGPQVLGGACLAILLAGLAGLLLARTLTRPLRHLTTAASALARGEPTPAIPLASTTELERLGAAFNTMNVNLTAAHDALAAQACQREAILDGLADAVLGADATGEIILANPAASTLLEIVPQPLHEAIRGTLALGTPQATEITAQGRVIELLTTPLRDENGHVSGAVAVGHDVTAYRQLDRLRTNFVSDVSHELRTPLTAIKGFVETLLDGAADDPAVRDRFLRTIATETDRLTRLANDLLLLTRADAGRLDLHLSPTDLVRSAERAVAQLEGRAHERQIAVTIEPPDVPTSVLADGDRVHQVLVNLLDNGIRFTPAEGRVSISFGRTGEQVSCTVADTGPGIPGNEMPHLFERFYRGDRSRARAEGGTGAGLGLAITKAIVEAHSGHIWVESEPGQGTSITFTLPPAS